MGCLVSDHSSGDVVHVAAPVVEVKDTTVRLSYGTWFTLDPNSIPHDPDF